MKLLPPLGALPSFEATARLGSVNAAAVELGRTHSAVSKQISHLTELAGVPLFRKAGQGIALTDEGQAFADSIRSSMDGLEVAWRKLRRSSNDAVIDLGISATFAMRWLMPRMPRFYQRFPNAQVNFRMSGKVPVNDNDVDLVLTWDRLRWQFGDRTDIVVLGDVAFGIVHSPALEVRLEGNRLIASNRCVQELPGEVWTAYRDLTGNEVLAETATAYPHTFLVIEAALAGFGLALVEKRLVVEELQDGRLVAPFGFASIQGGFGAILTRKEKPKGLLVEFLRWLEEEGVEG